MVSELCRHLYILWIAIAQVHECSVANKTSIEELSVNRIFKFVESNKISLGKCENIVQLLIVSSKLKFIYRKIFCINKY